MKTLTLTITGVQKYWAHHGLVRIVERLSGWDEAKVKKFLAQNQFINFDKQNREDIRGILDDLEHIGFQVDLVEVYGGIKAAIGIPDENILTEIKTQLKEIREEPLFGIQTQLKELSEKIDRFEARQSGKSPEKKLGNNPIYQKITAPEIELVAPPVKKEQRPVTFIPKPVMPTSSSPSFSDGRKSTAESDIGKYWLSKIGIFMLLLGVVFLITYTAQFLGAWGRLAIGMVLGGMLASIGNFLSRKEKYYKWAMSAIGGGWAIIYFTTYAAYHVPVVKVIQSPFVGFVFMLAAASAFIAQAFKHQSRVLAFMAYFLAYFATVSTEISFYTLAASYLLGVSAVLVTRKLGSNWLAFFSLLAVYGIHWTWVEPSIYAVQSHTTRDDRFLEMIVAPWIWNEWQIYPLIDQVKSYLHLSFLSLYWLLFTAMSILHDKVKKEDSVITAISLINGLVFIFNFMHHLHTYYPSTKWIFSLIMGITYLWLSVIEHRQKQEILSDIYLVFSVAMFCLIVPMYFTGPSITYGWSAACTSLIWIGIHHKRAVLKVIGWILAVIVVFRMAFFDYLERAVLFKHLLPIYPFLFVAAFAGAAFYLIGHFYERAREFSNEEKTLGLNTGFILSAAFFGIASLMGGLRDIASSLFVLIAIPAMRFGVIKKKPALRYTAIIFILLATLRFVFIDGSYGFSKFLSDPLVMIRYIGTFLSVGILFVLGEWMRRQSKTNEIDRSYFHYLSISSAFLFVVLLSDPSTKSLLSLIWGAGAFLYIIYGFKQKEGIYRWIGLGTFLLVLCRLFAYDFAQLVLLYRIISFIGLGLVFIIASFLYNYYSKMLLGESEN